MLTEISIIVVLIVFNGVMAMSELAVVSSRPARLKLLADQGSVGAKSALKLIENPGRFLSTVQIGITLVGVLSGAFSGATLGLRLSDYFRSLGLANHLAEAFGVGIVVALITYFSLIIGELVPKQLALGNPERVAAKVAPAMAMLSRIAAPLVWLLDVSGRSVLKLMGKDAQKDEVVTEEEVKSIIAEAEQAGVIESVERDMISGVMRFADKTSSGLMTPRREVEILDLSDEPDQLRHLVRTTRRTRLPVRDGGDDDIIGVVFVQDIIEAITSETTHDFRSYIQTAPAVSNNAKAIDVLRAIQSTTVHMALVFDEYGHFEGVVTSTDVLSAIAGAFREESDEVAYIQREDGSYLVSGWMPIDEFTEKLGPRVSRTRPYETVAGLVLAHLQHFPKPGEVFMLDDWRIEIVDTDGMRIDKILLSKMLQKDPLA